MNQILESYQTPHISPSRLWSVCCEDFGENRPRYNGTALYAIKYANNLSLSLTCACTCTCVLLRLQPWVRPQLWWRSREQGTKTRWLTYLQMGSHLSGFTVNKKPTFLNVLHGHGKILHGKIDYAFSQSFLVCNSEQDRLIREMHQATQAYCVIGQRLNFIIFFIRYVLSWSLGCLCFQFLSATAAAIAHHCI